MKNIFRFIRLLFSGLVPPKAGFLFAVFCLFTATNPLLAQWIQTNGPGGLALTGPVSVPTSATFTVNSTGDGSDSFPGDGLCRTSMIPPFICTLRAAIQEANASPGLDVINFSIGTGVQTITPASPLPTITDPVIIDGTTQPGIVPGIPCIVAGHPCIELNGFSAGCLNANGLHITAGNSTVRGLVINRFCFSGIELQAGGGNVIQRNFIGTDVNGTADLGNGSVGVEVFQSPNNTIGGTTVGARNVISGNTFYGILIANSGATGNQVLGNFIGTDLNGTAALGNSDHGVYILAANNNIIGGTVAGERNIISGNGEDGVRIEASGATGNQVLGNFIGTDVTGTVGLRNFADGVLISASPNNTIGGTVAGAKNVISGNNARGILIEGPAATGNQVLGNFIGTDVTGTVGLGNAAAGVVIRNGASNNTIGGMSAGVRNVISGNSVGISIGSVGPVTTGNQVLGNFIGTNATGTAALGNNFSGVSIGGASGNTIGGTTAGAGNVISGNFGNGVSIAGFLGNEAAGNLVQGNFIGIDVTGTIALGNNAAGVSITTNAPNSTIGGTVAGARNVISDNRNGGIFSQSTGTLVQGNFIGTDVTGTAALGNGNNPPFLGGDGVSLSGANSTIGGAMAGAGNVISASKGNGISIRLATATGISVQGNFIGTDVTGMAALGNDANGVWIERASNNAIGGMASGAGNTIAFNGGDGVLVDSSFGPTTGNTIFGNSVFSNVNLGIDLFPDGPTPNDLGDGDAGANNLQNFPILTSADSVGANTTILGTFNSTANDSFRLEFFANDSCDSSGYGEGQTFIGSTNVLTDGSGNASINITFPVAVPGGKFITATATDTAGNTSEFSQCRIVQGTTSVGSLLEEVPQVFALKQNYPNPFNPSTKIVYRVKSRESVSLRVFDVLGREVATLVNGVSEPGENSATFDGSHLSSGVYFYRLQAGDFTMTRKMLLLR